MLELPTIVFLAFLSSRHLLLQDVFFVGVGFLYFVYGRYGFHPLTL